MKTLELYFSQLVGVTAGEVLGLRFSCHQAPVHSDRAQQRLCHRALQSTLSCPHFPLGSLFTPEWRTSQALEINSCFEVAPAGFVLEPGKERWVGCSLKQEAIPKSVQTLGLMTLQTCVEVRIRP